MLIETTQCGGCWDCFILISLLLPLINSLWGKYHCLPQVTERETMAQRGEANCPSLKEFLDGAPLYKHLQVGYSGVSKVEKRFKISQSIPTVVQASKSWFCFSREQYSFTLPPSCPSLGRIQAQCLLEPSWGKQEAQSCGLPLGPFHPDPLLCPGSFAAPCGVKPLQSGEVTRRWPAHFSTVTSLKTHCTSLEGPFGCNVRKSDLPPRGKAAPGIQLWAAASSHPCTVTQKVPGPAAKTVKWLVSACQPSLKKGSLKGDAIQTFPWEFLLFISLSLKKKKVLVWTEMSHPQAPQTQISQNRGKDSRSCVICLSSASGLQTYQQGLGFTFLPP